MSISVRNRLDVEISNVKTGAINSLITAKLKNGEILKATISVSSEKNLELKIGKKAVFLFEASNVVVAKDGNLKLSATNQISGTISKIIDTATNSKIIIDIKDDQISALITKSSCKKLALKTGDKVTAIIKTSQIIVGVKV
ncbi:TOBE domain-containing protein [Campylobacter sp. RM13119]|uniref:TOBE domain-containing protein n=1 Tax=Campylobacter TaxID=194 RepID=UPI0014763634|nr:MULTISPECIES: TOBE domain-containing protein [unclassified Campylobacter]MBE3606551.1 TOBE domain-containing protein [Campylobacter sp. RM13119]